MEATEFLLEIDATLDCSGRGYQVTHMAGGGRNSSTAASGAGHASDGGSGHENLSGGFKYGSIYRPTMLGSRGGTGPNGLGARGGGRMRIRVGHKFILDGILKAEGDNAAVSSGRKLHRFLI